MKVISAERCFLERAKPLDFNLRRENQAALEEQASSTQKRPFQLWLQRLWCIHISKVVYSTVVKLKRL